MLSPAIDFTSTPPLWLQITVVAVWVSFILLIAWVVHRFAKGEPEIVRKIVHIGTGNVIMLAWWLDVPASLGITASIVASAITLLSYRFPLLPGINSVGRQSLGTFFYAVSMGILVAWFWHIEQPQYAAIGIMVMAWGDGLAALIGQRFGKHKYKILGAQKSWEGSLTMALVSFIISIRILLSVEGNVWQTWVVSLAIALAATSLEAISFLGIDNLTVPLGSASLAFVLIEIFLHHSP
ncbi:MULTISPECIES: diacylglycerol/polyprenol kinase family protein [Cyanophyceae]|uniref:diacylglycerol/polyprenol kinase family protein n=1 Tax=Cyanophyceae TaxID=3028117 RepID=UPI00232F1851|nr:MULTISPECIES: diacylglycerol/polyprenol kinase family protein [Cyanophyceae]MDB9340440.1 SEC59/DGK1/VTE5 family protein [Nodularia spumigena CS-589/07]MDB9344397.1 SEC59/DGK1/VTE5 family protein [Nodularia spumigena CS-588/06]MDB9370572.1 SEC59/DGK1/VTE5 family protein [Nodularia spumigena CS-586/05]MDB9399747.1 SEC59/DGK1/VTE5 family protein [Microcystis aeruginosa CS-567/02-A1]MDB9501078.1 SEC59/DGK1/VTE5 family protein [Nodularia spumigena CS-336/02]